MPSYTTVVSPATSFTVFLGSKCMECYALVQDADKWLHDNWHADLLRGTELMVKSGESDQEMLRRLLREVLALSQRMPDDE